MKNLLIGIGILLFPVFLIAQEIEVEGDLNLKGNKVKNIGLPADSTDAVPKHYVLLRVSLTGDTLYLGDSQWVIIPGISAANPPPDDGIPDIPDPDFATLQVSSTSFGYSGFYDIHKPFSYDKLTTDGQNVYDAGSGGGSSQNVESLSLNIWNEMLYALLKNEFEIQYIQPGDMFDYLITKE